MRFLQISLPVLLITLLTIPHPAYNQSNGCLATTRDSANVRAEPSTEAAILGLLIPTNPARVMSAQAGWYQVQRDDFGIGWVAALVVTLSGDCDAFTTEWNPFVQPFDLTGMDILFVRDEDGLQNLYAMNVNGNDVRQLTTGGTVIPIWSPDGSQAVFTADPYNTGSDIYWMSSDGTTIRNLTQDGADNDHPIWSPDGTQIAFTSMRDAPDVIEQPFGSPNFVFIYVMNVDGSNLHRVVPPPEPFEWFNTREEPQGWTNDGRLVFLSLRNNTEGEATFSMQLYTINPDGSDLVNLTALNGIDSTPYGQVAFTAISSDGSQIAFIVSASSESDLYIVNADGSNLRRLTENARYEYAPVWSPNDTQIALVGLERLTAQLYPDVFVINVDGSEERSLTEGSPYEDGISSVIDYTDPRWSSDGTQIGFTFVPGLSGSRICHVNADGSDLFCGINAGLSGRVLQWLP